jgi:hypothetical protein
MRFARTLAILALSSAAFAAPMTNTAKLVIPYDVQQVIVVDYKTFYNSPSAMALKEKVMPPPLKQFETALRNAGVNPEQDVDQLVFASYRDDKALKFVGVAQGQFPGQKLLAKFKKDKTKPERYQGMSIYPMGSGMYLSLLDNFNMLFGEKTAVKQALDVRNGQGKNLSSNNQITDMLASVENEPVWSVLDSEGTQYMLKSALGDVADLADYNVVKNRLKGSRYKVNFTSGVDFNLDVVTSDTFTAASLASLAKAGMMVRKSATDDAKEKLAIDSMKITSDSNNLKLGFKTDETKFQALLNSDLFKAVSK